MAAELVRRPSRLAAWWGARWDGDLAWSFRHTPSAMIAALILLLIVASAVLAPLITPQNPYDLTQLFLDQAELPPAWTTDGALPFLLGTDPQGRDVFSAILYGSRISLVIGLASVVLATLLGIAMGLLAGYHGGWLDNLLMRIGDTVLSLPTLLIAILFNAVCRQLLPGDMRELWHPASWYSRSPR